MTRSTSPAFRAIKWLLVSLVAFAPAVSSALTVLPFGPVRSQLTNEIAALEALPDPSASERARLRTLSRANEVFSKPSLSDGRALRTLKSSLGRLPEYAAALDSVASNLVAIYNNEHNFVGLLIPELPPSPAATAVAAQYNATANTVAKLNSTVNAMRTAALYDSAKRRLDTIFIRANQALLIPFPADLPTNSLVAKIDNGTGSKSFRATSDSSDLNEFQAVRHGDTIALTISVVESARGLLFTIPNVQAGTFRYEIPSEASFTNRTDFNFFDVPPSARDVGATNGSIFASTTASEVFGSFECTGPDFGIISGRFRVNITTP